ncbi:MAG: hypothetical protein WC592_05110 [Candidatus Omnitrophota bacterium]|nr:hypothetical protein [Candidatus Omnitrophota bacterium]
MNKTNRTITLWIVFILAVLAISLKADLNPPVRYILAGAIFLISAGLFFGVKK